MNELLRKLVTTNHGGDALGSLARTWTALPNPAGCLVALAQGAHGAARECELDPGGEFRRPELVRREAHLRVAVPAAKWHARVQAQV